MQTLYPGPIGIWRCCFFVDEGKPEIAEENPWNKARTNITGSKSGPGPHWRGLSPLRRLCSPRTTSGKMQGLRSLMSRGLCSALSYNSSFSFFIFHFHFISLKKKIQ